jgi:FAD/FMN-containing dehydrogenase
LGDHGIADGGNVAENAAGKRDVQGRGARFKVRGFRFKRPSGEHLAFDEADQGGKFLAGALEDVGGERVAQGRAASDDRSKRSEVGWG